MTAPAQDDRWHLPPVRISERLDASAVGEIIPEHLTRAKVPDVWQYATGKGLKVGIVDTGTTPDHEDLAGQIGDLYDATGSRSGPVDIDGHGTHVSGIIAAILRNGRGVAGVAPDARIYMAKGLGDDGSGTSDSVARAIRWCVDQGCQIINMSLGSRQLAQSIARAVRQAYDAGVVIVAANGNDGGPVNYPGALPETISVSALDFRAGNWVLADFSSRGEPTDLAAPGVDILSTYNRYPYVRMSGTSMAAPFVTGLCAIALQLDPTLKGKDAVLERLASAASDLGQPGKDSDYGSGLVTPVKLRPPAATIPAPDGLHLGPLVIHSPAVAGDLLSVAWSP